MLLLGINKYPFNSTKEVINRMFRMPRLPEYIGSRGNYAYACEEGLVGLVIYEFDSSKADEAILEINKANVKMYDIPGISMQLIPLYEARESAKTVLEAMK